VTERADIRVHGLDRADFRADRAVFVHFQGVGLVFEAWTLVVDVDYVDNNLGAARPPRRLLAVITGHYEEPIAHGRHKVGEKHNVSGRHKVGGLHAQGR